MFNKDTRGLGGSRLEPEISSGWVEYRQALELISQSEWRRAMVLLAESETMFRTSDSMHGLWRALLGQALLHWREGAEALAIARAMGALHAAEATDDGAAVGCVAWQIANMVLGQGEYRKAADFLDQAQLSLDAAGIAPPGGVLAAAGQLCAEIARWQQLYERQQIGRREAETAIAEIQRDLLLRLRQAAQAMRSAPLMHADTAQPDMVLTVISPPLLQDSPTIPTTTPSLSAWLVRLWRRLIHGDDLPEAILTAPAPPAPGAGGELGPSNWLPLPSLEEPAEAPQADEIDETLTPLVGEPILPAAPEHNLELPQLAPQPRHRAGLAINCFGTFRVAFNDTHVDRWESARARTIFKYLIVRRSTPVPKDLLADMFWPDSEPELARRSLHQAIYCLRQTFKRIAPDVQFIQFSGDHYQINPEIELWVDSEAFAREIEQARMGYGAEKPDAAMKSYAIAIDLYTATFLPEDRYETWTDEPRRTYQSMYLEALHRLARHHYERAEHASAILLCQRVLAEESCDEDAHQLLMACYVAQGLRHLAVRQYQICVNTLKTELGLAPSEELVTFYHRAVAPK